MTVVELIAELVKMEPDAAVYLFDGAANRPANEAFRVRFQPDGAFPPVGAVIVQ
jgi:hypothetical protein